MPKTLNRRSPSHSINALEIDLNLLKRAREILGLNSDTEVLNHALSSFIVNDELESAIEQAFRTVPYFKTS